MLSILGLFIESNFFCVSTRLRSISIDMWHQPMGIICCIWLRSLIVTWIDADRLLDVTLLATSSVSFPWPWRHLSFALPHVDDATYHSLYKYDTRWYHAGETLPIRYNASFIIIPRGYIARGLLPGVYRCRRDVGRYISWANLWSSRVGASSPASEQ